MANRRWDQVGYRKFRSEPYLAEGLLAVARPGGEFLDRVSNALFSFADQMGRRADSQAEAAGSRAGRAAALAGGPDATFPEGYNGTAAGAGRVRGRRFAGDVQAAIDRAASENGEDAGVLTRIAQIESGGNPNAKNPTSTAGGLFQQVDSNAAQYGVGNRFDAYQSASGAAKFQRDNRAYLRRQLGREPTGGELYLAHQQGPAGAAKLLKNPDASASSLVGAKAVRLNGGRPGMTGQQFANLWIERFNAGYSIPETPEQIDGTATASTDAGAGPTPPAAGPVLSGGRWRPSGSDTIYGRAYDEAGTRVYLQTLDTEMRSTTRQVYEKYRDDPVALEKALQDLGGAIRREHVFDDILPEYANAFEGMAEGYLSQARENLRIKVKQQDTAAFIERTGALETDVQRNIAALDPRNPDTAGAIKSSLDAIDDHYDSAVRRGILDPDDAARAKITTRRNTVVGFYARQADDLDADGVKAMRAKISEDFGKGEVDGLDGEGFDVLDRQLEALETKKRYAAERIEDDLRKRGDAMAVRVAAGFDIPQADMSKLVLDAGNSAEGRAAMQETYAKVSVAGAIRDMTLAQATAHVAGLRKQYGKEATTAQIRTLAFAEQVLADKRTQLATDPVSYAEGRGIVAETPMLTEAQDGQQLAGIVSSRVQAADRAAAALGVGPRYLKAGEAKAIVAAVRAEPEKGAMIAAGIVQGAGDRAPQVLAEFGQDAPMISEAGAILAFGGSARAAEDVILGYGKSPDGKQQKGLKPDAAAERFSTVAGDALALAPRDAERVSRAAASITRRRITAEGVEPDSEEAGAIYDQAVQEAAGAVFDAGVQWGGFVEVGGGWFGGGTKVIVPPTMRADRFADVLNAITDADLAALPEKPKAGVGFYAGGRAGGGSVPKGLAATIRGATPVVVNGGYAFALGDPASDDPQFVQDDKGGVFVLDIGKLPQLAERVPGAFR